MFTPSRHLKESPDKGHQWVDVEVIPKTCDMIKQAVQLEALRSTKKQCLVARTLVMWPIPMPDYTTYIKQMSFDNISVLIRLHFNTFFAYSITNLLLLLDRRHRPVSAYPPVSSYPPVPSSVVTILSSASFHSPVDDPSCAAHLRNYPVYFISVPLCYDDWAVLFHQFRSRIVKNVISFFTFLTPGLWHLSMDLVTKVRISFFHLHCCRCWLFY
jgi:hypothetical protein